MENQKVDIFIRRTKCAWSEKLKSGVEIWSCGRSESFSLHGK